MHRWYVWILAPLIIYIWTSAMFSYLGLPTHGLGTRLKVDNIEFTLWSQEKMVMDQLKELKPMYQQMILEGWWPWLTWWCWGWLWWWGGGSWWWYGWQVCSPLNLPSLLLKALKVGNFHANFQTFSKQNQNFSPIFSTIICSPCGWIVRWRTPWDRHSAQLEAQKCPSGVDGTFHFSSCLQGL